MLLFARCSALSVLCLAAALMPARAQPQEDGQEADPAWRYADVQRCLARGLGPHWDRTYQVEQVRNRWGELEPRAQSLASAPQAVRITELRCRYQAGLEDAQRP